MTPLWFDYEDDDENLDIEEIQENCGYNDEFLPPTCELAGTEHCSFWCPLNHIFFGGDEDEKA